MPDFPLVFDATMLRTFKGCPRKFYLEFLRNKVPSGLNPDLNAGSAWAKAHETFRKTYFAPDSNLSVDDCVAYAFIELTKEYGDEENDPPPDSPKQYDRLVEALIAYYYEEYPPLFDDHKPKIIENYGPAVEFSFAEPFEEVLHPETNEPILYAGTFDMLSEKSGLEYVFDDKTSKQMGYKWSDQWSLRSQFIGYVWGARKSGYKPQGVWVRGTAFKKTTIDFADATVSIPKWLVDEWEEVTEGVLKNVIRMWNANHFPKNLDDSCSAYGGCPFLDICKTPDSQTEPFLQEFEDRNWNPVAADTY